MDNIKNSLKENKLIIAVGCVVVVIAIVAAIYNSTKKESIYEKDLSKIEVDNYIQTNYKVNEYRVINISELDLLNEYLKDYLNKTLNNPEEAWNLLSKKSQEKFNNNVDEYKKYIKSNTSINTKNNEVVEYRDDEDNDYTYDIIDSEGNKYIIFEKSTWDIEITLNGKK